MIWTLIVKKTLVRAEGCVRQFNELHHQRLPNERWVKPNVRPHLDQERAGGRKKTGWQELMLEPRATHHQPPLVCVGLEG